MSHFYFWWRTAAAAVIHHRATWQQLFSNVIKNSAWDMITLFIFWRLMSQNHLPAFVVLISSNWSRLSLNVATEEENLCSHYHVELKFILVTGDHLIQRFIIRYLIFLLKLYLKYLNKKKKKKKKSASFLNVGGDHAKIKHIKRLHAILNMTGADIIKT